MRLRSPQCHSDAQFYQSLLDQAKEQGALPKTIDTQTTASALLGLVLGMRVCARGGGYADIIYLKILRPF